MSQPAHYQQVIARVIERNADRGLSPSDLAACIVEGLDLAEAILGDGPAPKAKTNILIQTSERQYKEVDLGQGVLIGAAPANGARIIEEAPPTAIVRNPDSAVMQDTYEEVEKKKAKLQSLALNTLPISLTIDLPDVGKITLNRHVRPSPQGTEFVRVLYAQDASEEDGPQVNLFTSDMKCDPATVKADILSQAAMRYRKARPTITPRMAVNQGFPDPDQLTQQALKNGNTANRTDENTPVEDSREWDRLSNLKRLF